MKVLLVNPVPPRTHWPRGAVRCRWVPTGLAYLASALRRAGHEVRVHVREEQLIKNDLDWQTADALLRELLVTFAPDMVGISVMTPAVEEAQTICQWAKELCGAHVLTVVGGVHPSAIPEQTLAECPSADVAVIGEAEETIVELASDGPRNHVAGIAYRDGGTVVRTSPRRPPMNLDALGPPAWDLFDMEHYTSRDRWMIRWLPLRTLNIRTSRGCTNRCRFCAGHLVAGLGVRFHSLDYVMDQIRQAVDRFGVEAIHFEDDTIGADRNRLLELCDRLQREGLGERLKWECCLRVDQADAELLRAMKQAGCVQIEYGFESASDAALRRLGKNATSELNRQAVMLTRQAGIRIFADILVGLPGETQAEFDSTVKFLRWAKPEIISAARLCPLPGTPIFDQLPAETRRRIRWAEYAYLSDPAPAFNLTAMSDEQFEKQFRRFYRYVVRPQESWAILRDTASDDLSLRRRLRRKLLHFALRHPLRALRVPW